MQNPAPRKPVNSKTRVRASHRIDITAATVPLIGQRSSSWHGGNLPGIVDDHVEMPDSMFRHRLRRSAHRTLTRDVELYGDDLHVYGISNLRGWAARPALGRTRALH